MLRATYGESTPRAASAELALARLAVADGDPAAALAPAEAALAAFTASLPRGHVDRVAALGELSDIFT